MSRLIAIGDVHGCFKTLKTLLFDELSIKQTDEVYCIGDYIDRGPDSKAVIDLILFLRNEGYIIHTLRGNHEQMMLDALNNKLKYEQWLRNGGDTTLKSFGISSLDELPLLYIEFLSQTQYFFETSKYIFVHAGLNFNISNPLDDTESMLWIRDFTIDPIKVNGRMIIHGHTPKPFDFIVNQLKDTDVSSVNIDGGCIYKHKPDMGNLFAINLTEMKFVYTRNIDI